jgi:hypothetical protein
MRNPSPDDEMDVGPVCAAQDLHNGAIIMNYVGGQSDPVLHECHIAEIQETTRYQDVL